MNSLQHFRCILAPLATSLLFVSNFTAFAQKAAPNASGPDQQKSGDGFAAAEFAEFKSSPKPEWQWSVEVKSGKPENGPARAWLWIPPGCQRIRKCMYNLANWQYPNKALFSPIPAGNWKSELPQQMLVSVGQYGLWTYHLHTGDKKSLADVYPHVRDYLSLWQIEANGLVVHRNGENGWNWADWGNEVDMRVLDQAWFCLALEGAARMANELGRLDEAAAYETQRAAIITAVNSRFWNGQVYRDSNYKGATDDRAQGMAVIAGIASPDKFPALRAELAKSFHTSPYLENYILEALFRMDAPGVALERLHTRYADMVSAETTTLWELFSRKDKNWTINHAWTGGPLILMYEEVAGVAPTSPGYATYRVTPRLGPLKRVEAGFDSVKGRIEVKITNNADAFRLTLKSPPPAPRRRPPCRFAKPPPLSSRRMASSSGKAANPPSPCPDSNREAPQTDGSALLPLPATGRSRCDKAS